METLGAIVLIVAAWLLGAIPWGVVLGITLKGIDPRKHGSGGTGATNSLRLLGAPIAIGVLVLDLAKGMIPVVLARWFDLPDWAIALTAIAPVIGHCWSPFINFKGGKGMATGGAAAIALFPWLLALFVPMVLIVWLTRYVSLASIIMCVVGPLIVLATAIWSDSSGWWALAIVAIAAIIVYQHRTNIRRLLAGTENRFGTKVAT